jgi:homoserine kinase type II
MPACVADPSAFAAAWLGTPPLRVARLGATGFSGAEVFHVVAAAGQFVLKSFPAGMSFDRAAWVHRLMRHLRAAGVEVIPAPRPTATGATCVADPQGRLWELVEYLPGRPTAAPSVGQVIAAVETLARIHIAAAALPLTAGVPAPGGERRRHQVLQLLADPWAARRQRLAGPAPADPLGSGMRARFDLAITGFGAAAGQRALTAFAAVRPAVLPVQPVLRDVWADHVLFATAQPERLTGLIDLQAAGCDSPATDLARLLGNWASPWGGDGRWITPWEPALAAYDAIRGLTAAERQALPLLHASAVVLGLDNWFRWVFDDRRRFAAAPALDRVDRLLGLLPQALDELLHTGPPGGLATRS